MLCSWKKGDIISAYHLNQMVCAINNNDKRLESLTNQFDNKGTSSINATGGIDMGAFLGSALQPCESCLNRGFIRTGWEYTASNDSVKTGVYLNKSGIETATGASYPNGIYAVKLCEKISGIPLEDIVIKVKTDEYGKVLSQCIKLQGSDECTKNTYWTGPEKECGQQPCYEFTRRVGRIISDEVRPVSSCDSTKLNKVMSTNDLVMPILPARAELENQTDCYHSLSLIGKFKENSILIKNIANAGGLKFDTSNANRVQMCSGVEFYKACVKESSESGETTTTTTWPDIPKHIEPTPFNVTIACIPVKEQHYKWCSGTSSWNPVNGSGDSTSGDTGPVLKSSVQIKAQSLCGSNWKIGWTSSGGVEIPVYDFFPTEAKDYTAGRGISICEVNENTGTEEEPNEVKKYYICNTMTLCAGCGVTICEPTCGKYKISSCKAKKVVAGCGICVTCENCSYKISAKPPALKLTAGDGICVSGSGLCWKITNTAMQEAIEIVGGCGICVTQTGNKYKVSAKAPCSTHHKCSNTYVFDSAWFTVSR